MAPKLTQKALFAILKADAQKKLPNRNDRKRGRDSSGPVQLNEKQGKLANLTGAKPTEYKKTFSGWNVGDEFLTNQKKKRERYNAKHRGEDPASGDLKWLLDKLEVEYDSDISQKEALRLWIQNTSGVRVWQAATLAMDYSLAADDWKDLSNEQAESILAQQQEDDANLDRIDFDDEQEGDDDDALLGDISVEPEDFTAGGSLEEDLAALDGTGTGLAEEMSDDDMSIAQLRSRGGKKATTKRTKID